MNSEAPARLPLDDQDGPPGHRTFAGTVLGIAGSVRDRRSGGTMDRGARAELRRMRSDAVFPPEPFWTLVSRYDIHHAEEPFWMDVIPLMVDHPHNSGVRPGRALAEAGVSAARVERWLRLDAERARRESRRLLARLDSGLNWVAFASLLRFWGDDANRRAFARDFFLSDAHRARSQAKSQQEEK